MFDLGLLQSFGFDLEIIRLHVEFLSLHNQSLRL